MKIIGETEHGDTVYASEPPKEGVKFDAGKIDPTFVVEYFGDALLAVAAVSGYGERKYSRGGWRTVDNGVQRYTAAMLRHYFAERRSAYDEGDSGLAHAAQVAWNALARLQFQLESDVLEIRSGNDIVDGKPVLGTSKKIA